jgi:cation diffusion facilitator CzcD-associated flavoprotein CzcO
VKNWDAVVIGAGPNGLAAANHLADAGWSVLVLEAQDEIGGAVRSNREVHPDFIHDTFSSFYPPSRASVPAGTRPRACRDSNPWPLSGVGLSTSRRRCARRVRNERGPRGHRARPATPH